MEITPNRDAADRNTARTTDLEAVLSALRVAQTLFDQGNEQIGAIIDLLSGREPVSVHSDAAVDRQGLSEMAHILTDPDEQLEDE